MTCCRLYEVAECIDLHMLSSFRARLLLEAASLPESLSDSTTFGRLCPPTVGWVSA